MLELPGVALDERLVNRKFSKVSARFTRAKFIPLQWIQNPISARKLFQRKRKKKGKKSEEANMFGFPIALAVFSGAK